MLGPAPFDIPRTLTVTLGARCNQRPPTLPFWPQVVPALLFYFSDIVPDFLSHLSQLMSSPHLPTHLLPLPLSLTSLLCQVIWLMTKIFCVPHHLLWLCNEGSGDGRTDRTTQGHRGRGLARLQEGNWHKERISLKFSQEPLLPENVSSPLTGTLILVTPTELHSDLKHISTFYGGYGIRLQGTVEDDSFNC